jgi:integrase
MVRYLTLAVVEGRMDNVARKIALHLQRFASFYREAYGHERISTCLRRDVLAWQRELLSKGLAAATVNNHLASLSSFTAGVHAQAPRLFPIGDPAKGIGELGLPTLEPRTLSPEQVRSLKNLCDRLERFHQKRGRQ